MSINTIFPTNLTYTLGYILIRAEGHLSYALIVMLEGLSLGDPNFCQMDLDMIYVESPLLMMKKWMLIFWTETGIWKATVEGSRGVALSKSKTMRWESISRLCLKWKVGISTG